MTNWSKEESEAIDFILANLNDTTKCIGKILTLNENSRKKILNHLKIGVKIAKATRKVVNRSSELPTLVKQNNMQSQK